MPPAFHRRDDVRRILLVLLAAALMSGCGRRSVGPPRFSVRGRLTYRGEPVPFGEIAFEPDTAAGNRGPAGYGVVTNGRYETYRDKGAVSGPHTVRITGFDGNVADEFPQGKHLFIDYTTTINLPREDVAIDFDVPAHSETAKSKR
jgi:hypothetical protein